MPNDVTGTPSATATITLFAPISVYCAITACFNHLFTGSIACSATRRYLIYSEANFEVFRPAGATRCTDGGGVKFDMEEGTFPPLLRAKLHSHRCNGKGIGPLKLKCLLKFGQNVKYRRPAGAYSLRDFHKICRICTSFQDALAVKISLDLLKGYGVMGVLS